MPVGPDRTSKSLSLAWPSEDHCDTGAIANRPRAIGSLPSPPCPAIAGKRESHADPPRDADSARDGLARHRSRKVWRAAEGAERERNLRPDEVARVSPRHWCPELGP